MDIRAEADRLWTALLNQCAATRPEDRHKVKRLVMVTKADVVAALKAVRSNG